MEVHQKDVAAPCEGSWLLFLEARIDRSIRVWSSDEFPLLPKLMLRRISCTFQSMRKIDRIASCPLPTAQPWQAQFPQQPLETLSRARRILGRRGLPGRRFQSHDVWRAWGLLNTLSGARQARRHRESRIAERDDARMHRIAGRPGTQLVKKPQYSETEWSLSCL